MGLVVEHLTHPHKTLRSQRRYTINTKVKWSTQTYVPNSITAHLWRIGNFWPAAAKRLPAIGRQATQPRRGPVDGGDQGEAAIVLEGEQEPSRKIRGANQRAGCHRERESRLIAEPEPGLR
jgi:hypothetical protein